MYVCTFDCPLTWHSVLFSCCLVAPTVTQFNDVTVVTDRMAALECRVEAKPMPTFSWMTPAALTGFNVQNCIQDPTNNLIFISRLEFNRTAMPSDAGQYSCTGYNIAGIFSQNATLTVLGETILLHTSWDYTLNYHFFPIMNLPHLT